MRKVFDWFVLVLAVLGLAPQIASALSENDKKLIDKQIEDYLCAILKNWSKRLIICRLFWPNAPSVSKLKRWPKMQINSIAMKLITRWGRQNAPITIVEFFDYNCGYCKRSFAPLMEVLEENKDVRLVFKEYPILGEPSYLASSTALAINDKMKYLTYHSKLMTHSGRVSQAVVEKILGELKLPPQKLQTDARSDKYVLQLAATRQLADAIGVNGTPAFVINGQLFPGALNKAELTQAIKFARAELKAK